MLGVKGKKKKVIVGVYCKDCSSKSNEDSRKLAVDYKGGKCSKCGYNKCISALDFHHINPAEKDYPITQMRIFDDLMRAELDKCILLCANCHREEHYRLRDESKRARKEKFAKAQLNP